MESAVVTQLAIYDLPWNIPDQNRPWPGHRASLPRLSYAVISAYARNDLGHIKNRRIRKKRSHATGHVQKPVCTGMYEAHSRVRLVGQVLVPYAKGVFGSQRRKEILAVGHRRRLR